MKIALPHNLWSDGHKIHLALPDSWKVNVLGMEGDTSPVLGARDYRKAFADIEKVVRGAKQICILFDDLSRPTKACQVVPYLLEVFERCGVRDEQVRFLCSLGTHAPHDNVAFRKKLGPEVLERFPVFNHNPYDNCDDLGKTQLGTPIMVNREYHACDVKIGIGSLLPHSFCGVGGGYKIVMPGVAHIDAIVHHHRLLQQFQSCSGMGKFKGNALLEDVREFGRVAGLDIKIDVLVNTRAETVGMYAGPPDQVYGGFAQKALAHYGTPVPGRADVVFANVYGKANEAIIALVFAEQLLKEEGGDVVLLCDLPEGQVVHYTMGRFGVDAWGSLAFGERIKDPKTRRIFIFSRYKDLAGSFWFGKREELIWCNDLAQIVKTLEDEHRGKSIDVYVIPDGTVQIASPSL